MDYRLSLRGHRLKLVRPFQNHFQLLGSFGPVNGESIEIVCDEDGICPFVPGWYHAHGCYSSMELCCVRVNGMVINKQVELERGCFSEYEGRCLSVVMIELDG